MNRIVPDAAQRVKCPYRETVSARPVFTPIYDTPLSKPDAETGEIIIFSTLELCALPSVQQAVRHLAQKRTAAHDAYRKPHEDLGAGRNEHADYWGLLAEFALYLELERLGLRPDKYVLFAERAPVGPDFCLNGRTFNVKAVPPGKSFLCVNEKQRADPRHYADYVLPIVFTGRDTLSVFAPVCAAAVGTWALREGHSPYRSVHIGQLPPLANLRLLMHNFVHQENKR